MAAVEREGVLWAGKMELLSDAKLDVPSDSVEIVCSSGESKRHRH